MKLSYRIAEPIGTGSGRKFTVVCDILLPFVLQVGVALESSHIKCMVDKNVRKVADWSIADEVHHGVSIVDVKSHVDWQVVLHEVKQHKLGGILHLASGKSTGAHLPAS